jgi:predicted RecA/RadA family phage recombinase
MSTVQYSNGQTVSYTAAADIPANAIVDLGNGLAGVALSPIANGATGILHLGGAWTLPKKDTTDVFAVGSAAIVNVTSGVHTVDLITVNSATTTAQVNSIVGNAVAASNSAATTVVVRLKA